MFFALCENMIFGVREPWLVEHSNSNERGRVFAKGQLDTPEPINQSLQDHWKLPGKSVGAL